MEYRPIAGETCISSMSSSTSSIQSLTEVSSVSSLPSSDSLAPYNDQKGLPISLFPCLDSKPGSNSSWQSTEVPFKDVDILQSYCTRNEVSALAVFQTAWALVLRCYLNNSSVCFVYSLSQSKDRRDNGAMPPHLGVCQVDFETGIPLFDILKRASMQCSEIPSRPSKAHPFIGEQSDTLKTLPMNTSLVYRGENQQNGSGVVSSTIEKKSGTKRINVWSTVNADPPIARLHD